MPFLKRICQVRHHGLLVCQTYVRLHCETHRRFWHRAMRAQGHLKQWRQAMTAGPGIAGVDGERRSEFRQSMAAAWFELVDSQERKSHFQRSMNCRLANLFTISLEREPFGPGIGWSGGGDEHRADRFLDGSPTRASDSGDR